MQYKIKSFWVPKRGNSTEEYEDAFSIGELGTNSNLLKIAVADGASEGFFSKIWADILVKFFCLNEYKDVKIFLEHCNQDWKEWKTNYLKERIQCDRPIQWFEEDGVQKGAFSTFAGVTIDKENFTWNLIAVGDSCLFQIRDGSLLQSFPLLGSDSFNNRPVLLSSENPFTEEIHQVIFIKSDLFQEKDTFLLMTDALAAWFLKEVEIGKNPVETLNGIFTQDEFESLIDVLREEQKLHNDDVTLVTIK